MIVEAFHNLGRGVHVHVNGQERIRYTHTTQACGHPYFHPVRSPAGHVLTNFAPSDHPWHGGLWLSWKEINGVNVWEGTLLPEGDSEIIPLPIRDVTFERNTLSFRTGYRWQRRNGEGLLEGDLQATIHPPHDRDYSIDLDYTFRPCGEMATLGRVPYDPETCDWGGYAGLSYRPIRDFFNPSMTSSEEEEGVTRWSRVRWLDLSGQIDGLRDTWGGVCLMDHPSNVRHPVPANFHEPHWYHLRWSQLAVLADDDLVLTKGEELRLRYRVVVHDGKADRVRLDTIWREWAG